MTEEIKPLTLNLSTIGGGTNESLSWTPQNIEKGLQLVDRIITTLEKREILKNNKQEATTSLATTNTPSKRDVAVRLYSQFTMVMSTLRDTYKKTTITEALEFIQANEVLVIDQIERGL